MVELLILVALVFGGIALWRRTTEKRGSPHKPPALPSGYRAEWLDGDYGAGWVIVREEDDQRLRWETLPKSDGLEAIKVVGTSYREDALQSPTFAPGKRLALIREPDNPHSESGDATAVYDASAEVQVGYVPSEDAASIAPRLDEGEEIRAYSMWESRKGGRRTGLRMLLVSDD